MPISSLVIRTKSDETQNVADLINQMLQANVSTIENDRIVVITETTDQSQDKALWDNIEKIPGVVQCDLIYHNFEDIQEGSLS